MGVNAGKKPLLENIYLFLFNFYKQLGSEKISNTIKKIELARGKYKTKLTKLENTSYH